MKSTALFLATVILSFTSTSLLADPIGLGTADTFAVLGASTVTNTGNTVLNGNLGLYPGTSITGFPPGTVNGTTYINNGVAMQAQADALTWYNFLAAMPSTSNLTGQDLGTLTLTPGVYTFSSSAQLTGPLTLDFGGVNNANIIFQIGSTLTTASASSINVINPGLNNNIYWQVGSSATLGTTTAFAGNILADQSITLNNSATINCGSAIALNGAVTLDTNTVSACSNGGISPVPEPGTFGLMATGILGAVGVLRRRLIA
jgi:hypothetical protein